MQHRRSHQSQVTHLAGLAECVKKKPSVIVVMKKCPPDDFLKPSHDKKLLLLEYEYCVPSSITKVSPYLVKQLLPKPVYSPVWHNPFPAKWPLPSTRLAESPKFLKQIESERMDSSIGGRLFWPSNS